MKQTKRKRQTSSAADDEDVLTFVATLDKKYFEVTIPRVCITNELARAWDHGRVIAHA